MKVFDRGSCIASARHSNLGVMLVVISLKVDKILFCQPDLLYIFSFMLV
jgi:hypothetical protein